MNAFNKAAKKQEAEVKRRVEQDLNDPDTLHSLLDKFKDESPLFFKDPLGGGGVQVLFDVITSQLTDKYRKEVAAEALKKPGSSPKP